MTADDELLYKVTKYGKLIKRKEKIAHALSRLSKVEMTLDILSATNIGRCVNKLCHDPVYGREAFRIIEKWKDVARQSGICGDEEDCDSEGSNLQEYEQSPTRDGLVNGVNVETKGYYDEVNDEFSGRNFHGGSDTDACVREEYHSSPTSRKKRHHDENKSDSYDQKKNCHISERDSESYRRRRDDVKDRKTHRNESSKRSHEGNRRHRSRDMHDRKQNTEARKGVESRNRDDSRSPVWGEHSDNDGNTETENVDEEYSSLSRRERVERGNSSSVADQRTSRISDERQSSSRIEQCHKRKRSPSDEVHSSSKAKSMFETKRSSSPCSESMHSSVLPSLTSKVKSACKKVVPDFGTMLISGDTPPAKTRKPREAHWKWTEVPVLSNYQPFPQPVLHTKEPHPTSDGFNPENMFKPRNERGKVFAGRRRVVSKDVTSLFTLCLRVLMNNPSVLVYAEYISYSIVKPVLERCTAEELASIESKHRYLEEDSEELWQRFVTKKYPGEKPEGDSSWKELYYFIEKEKEQKLKQLSLRIGKTHQQEATKGHRRAMLADATAPTFVKRRQMRHGTTHVSRVLPSALEVSSARRKIFETGGSKDALAALPHAIVKSNPSVGVKTESKKAPIKKGALMIKTMKMLKMRRK